MKRLLNCVLLIDDDEDDNFFHQRIIQKANITHRIDTVENGEEAITYLTTPSENSRYPQPDLIFLDINMPRMNGWEFLEAYQKLDSDQQGGTIVIMLTTSLNPADISKAKDISQVNDYKTKPLDREMLKEIVDRYFPDYL